MLALELAFRVNCCAASVCKMVAAELAKEDSCIEGGGVERVALFGEVCQDDFR